MPWGAAVAAAAISAGATIYGAHEASKSSKEARDAQLAAADKANNTELQMYNQTRTDNLPALGARNDALTAIENDLGVGGNPLAPGYGALGKPITVGDVSSDPGYQFGMDQGQKQIANQMAARGMRNSGAALMAGDRYATDYATTKTNDVFNRLLQSRNQVLNPLFSLADKGQIGTSQIGQAGMNYANQVGSNSLYAGDAAAQNALAQGSIRGNMANQLAGWYQNQQQPAYNPYSVPGYGQGYNGTMVNQGPSGGDMYGSYWGTE